MSSRSSQPAPFSEALASEHLPHLKAMGRRERRAAQTRVRLFRCALQLFAQRGFPNVTVEDITEAADVGKGTFFNYFQSKDHVLGVMPEIQLGKVREAMEQAEAGRQSVRSILRRLFHALGEEPGRSPDLARAILSSFLASAAVRRLLDRNLVEGRRMLARIVAAGQKRGEIDPGRKGQQVAVQAQQAVLGAILLWSLHGGARVQTWLEASFQHFWRAIEASGKESKR